MSNIRINPYNSNHDSEAQPFTIIKNTMGELKRYCIRKVKLTLFYGFIFSYLTVLLSLWGSGIWPPTIRFDLIMQIFNNPHPSNATIDINNYPNTTQSSITSSTTTTTTTTEAATTV